MVQQWVLHPSCWFRPGGGLFSLSFTAFLVVLSVANALFYVVFVAWNRHVVSTGEGLAFESAG